MGEIITLTDPCPHGYDRAWCGECERISDLIEELITYTIWQIMPSAWDEYLTMKQFFDAQTGRQESIVEIIASGEVNMIEAMLSLINPSREEERKATAA